MTDIKIVFVIPTCIMPFNFLDGDILCTVVSSFCNHNHFNLIAQIKIYRKVMDIKEFTFSLGNISI